MDTELPENILNEHIMHGIAVMRLYCALKSISSYKFTVQESEVLLDLITCQPPSTAVGMRFVVVSICTLLACAFLLRYVFSSSFKTFRSI